MPESQIQRTLILANADNPLLAQLVETLANHGIESVCVAQTAQAFLLLVRPDARIDLGIVLEALPGLAMNTVAKVLRGLPGQKELPLLLVDPGLSAPMRGLVLRPPTTVPELVHWATMSPEAWPSILPQETATQHLAASDCFDPRQVKEIERIKSGGGRQLITMLLEELPVVSEALQKHFSQADLEGLRRVAHKAKGSFGSLGAKELYTTCHALEVAAGNNDQENSAKLLGQVLQAMERLRPILIGHLGR